MDPTAFFSPLLNTNKKTLILWVSCIVLMVLLIYPGDESSFVKIFPDFTSLSKYDLDWYKYFFHHSSTFLLFFLIPVLIVLFVFKEKVSEYGFCLGDYKFGIKATLISFALLPLPLYINSFDKSFLAEYPLSMKSMESPQNFIFWSMGYLIYYTGWEFFFRGYLNFGFKNSLGPFTALWIQTLASTLIHIGKPSGETWSAIPGGLYLGLLAFRTRSIFWPLLFHFYLGMLNSYFCGLHH